MKEGKLFSNMDNIKDLYSVLLNIEKQQLDTYNEHTYDYSSGYRRCARDILTLINDKEEEFTE